MKKIFFFCKQYLSLHKWRLFFYVSISVIISLLSLVSPYIMGDFIDHLIGAGDINFIFRYFLVFAIISISTLVLGYISGRLYTRLQIILGYALNRDFIKRFQCAPLRFTQFQDTAYLNQRINNDANALIIFCISIIQNVIVNSFMIVVPAILLISFHPILASILLFMCCINVCFLKPAMRFKSRSLAFLQN